MSNRHVFRVLGDNVKALRKSSLTPEGARSINKYAKWAGVSNGSVDRIERGATNPELGHVARIAAKYAAHGIEIWHLFYPELDPLSPPALISSRAREAYTAIGEAYARLETKPPAMHEPGQPPKPQKVAVHSRRKRVRSVTP